MTRHTALISLTAARTERRLAERCCPHWDYESPSNAGEECCRDLDEAERKYRAAFYQWQEQDGNQ